MIVIVNTGGANLASVHFAFDRLSLKTKVTADPELIHKASLVIFPGVGAALDSMERLKKLELIECIRSLKQPTLGICLGMQLLFEDSEEGPTSCLGLIPGQVSKIPYAPEYRIPHMGWNRIFKTNEPCTLLENIPDGSFFYFVHSYRAPLGPWVKAVTHHSVEVPAVVQKDNYIGVQFHPERSADMGSRIIKNFVEL
jgi:glutamine amidotransferase